MTLYEIDRRIVQAMENGTDPETGEISNFDELVGLQMERDSKIENIACFIKNLKDDVRGLKEEAQVLTERRHSVERKIEGLERVLDMALDGQKFQTPRCVVSFRSTKAVEVEDADAVLKWACKECREDEFIRYKAPEINKSNLGVYLKSGADVPGARIVERRSLAVK